jgi:hypothetical protein
MANVVVEIPAELKALVPARQGVVDAVRTEVERGKTGGTVDYAAFERRLAERCADVERSGHQLALFALAVSAPHITINKVPYYRALENSETRFMSLAGPVLVSRSLYRLAGERNAPTVDPVALRVGAIEGVWLPAAAREMAFQVQQHTSREAEASGKRLGRLPYSHASFESVAHAVGAMYVGQHRQIEDALIETLNVPEEAKSVSVSLDRVSVAMEEPRPHPPGRPRKGAPKRPIERVYRMAYCGTVTLHDENGDGIYTIRYGTMAAGDPEGLCEGMARDVIELLAKRPDLKVMLLCDGAPEMWNLLDAEFAKAPFDAKDRLVARLIDFWHVIEKLAAAARVIAPEPENEAKVLLAKWKIRLRNSSLARETILEELRASGKEDVLVAKDKPVHEAITYLTNNAQRMNYASARRQNLPIGSGNVEATGKTLFNVRMKRAGSRWKNLTGEHIVHLRALALSDRWDAALDRVFKKPKVSIRVAA